MINLFHWYSFNSAMTLLLIFSGGPSDVLANVRNSVLFVTFVSAHDFEDEQTEIEMVKIPEKVNFTKEIL
jgi:hypothetical protein